MDELDSKPEILQSEVQEKKSFLDLIIRRVKNVFSRLNINKISLPASILFSAILISGVLLYTNRDSDTRDTVAPDSRVKVSVDDDVVLGNPKASVTIIEFSDFQCSFCRKFWKETLPSIKRDYIDTGKVRFVYRDFPLPFHSGAKLAAEFTECAEDQGKFWEMHDVIFEEQEKQGTGTISFSQQDLLNWAGKIGLNTQQLNQCMASGKYSSEVEKDIEDGKALGVNGTPMFFINGKAFIGAQPYSVFQEALELELK